MIRGFSKVAFLVFALSSGAALAAAPTFVFTAIPDQDETRLVERLSRCAQYLGVAPLNVENERQALLALSR